MKKLRKNKSYFGIKQLKNNLVIIIFLLFTMVFLTNYYYHSYKGKINIAAIELLRMNVFYLKVDNPIKVAVSGYNSSDLDVSIDNGSIEGQDGEFIVKPKIIGKAIITISHNGDIINKQTFRVKEGVGLSLAFQSENYFKVFSYQKHNSISKSDLLEVDEIIPAAINSDFDLEPIFEIYGFDLTVRIKDSLKTSSSKSNRFTKIQKSLIEQADVPSLIHLTTIRAKYEDKNILYSSVQIQIQ